MATGAAKSSGGGAAIAQDIGGTAAAPTVEGLQGEDLPDSVGDTLIKRNTANTAWVTVPYTGSDLTSDLAAKAATTRAVDAFGAPTDITTHNASTTAHGFSPKATAPSAGLLSVLAIGNGATVRSDTPIFDTTNPAALGSVGPGTALVAARRDHVHANPALDTLAAPTDITTLNASTTAHGLSPKATAPAAGLLNVLAIGNGGTAHTDTAIFDTTNPAALGTVGPGTALVAARRDHVHANPAIDTLAAATDITTLNASTTAHGLLKKLSNVSTEFMNGVGNWATPTAATDITGMTAATDFKALTDYIPVYDASAAANRKFLLYDLLSARNTVNIYTECFSPSTTGNTSDGFITGGTLTPTSLEGTAAHPGIISLTSTGSLSYLAMASGATNSPIIVGGGKWHFDACVLTPASLSDGTTRYELDAGLMDVGAIGSLFASGTYAIGIRYTDNVNGGKWQGFVKNAGSNTTMDLGIAVAASTWYTLGWEINAAGTSIQFYVNGAAAGTAVSTNIPTGAMAPYCAIKDTTGTGNRVFNIDFVQLIGELTTAR